MMNQTGQEKGGRQMRYRALLVTAFLVLSLTICGLSTEVEELTNDSRRTAVAVRITFMIGVVIRSHGREFDTVEPSSGRSNVFVFSGGEVRRDGSFEIEWMPGAAIKSVEWLEVLSAEEQQAMQEVADCSCVLSPTDSLESRLNNTYDGMVICLEPGSYTLTGTIAVKDSISIRGIHQSGGVAQIRVEEYGSIVIAVYYDRTLRLENISFGEGINEIQIRGTAVLAIELCNLPFLTLNAGDAAVASISDTSIGFVHVVRDSAVTLTNCTVEVGGVVTKEDARVSLIDSVIRDARTGVRASDNSVVRLIRSEFVNCTNDTQIYDSAKVEVEG